MAKMTNPRRLGGKNERMRMLKAHQGRCRVELEAGRQRQHLGPFQDEEESTRGIPVMVVPVCRTSHRSIESETACLLSRSRGGKRKRVQPTNCEGAPRSVVSVCHLDLPRHGSDLSHSEPGSAGDWMSRPGGLIPLSSTISHARRTVFSTSSSGLVR